MFALTATPPTPPPDNSVVAGPIGFTVFVLLIVAVAFLCWSFTKQLKKVDRATEAGILPTKQDLAAERAQSNGAATDIVADQTHDHDADA